MRHTARTAFCIILAAFLFGLAATTFAAEENNNAKSQFADLIALVRQRGWPTDLARICPPLGIELDHSQCLAQQVAFFAQGRERAFNLIPLKPGAVSYVVIIDVKDDAGKVYLANASGKLISMSTLTVGPKDEKVSTEEAESGFRQEIAFWSANAGQFDKWLEKRKYGPITPPQSTN